MSSSDEKAVNDSASETLSGVCNSLFRSRDDRIAAGKAIRQQVPHESHAIWKPSKNRRDPIEILQESNREEVAGRRRLVDQPPAMFHVSKKEFPDHDELVKESLEKYRHSLPTDRRVLFDRCSLEDVVVKAVGIGSVGTFCFVGLSFSAENHPLLLQFKQACASVSEPYAGKSLFENHGQRVVEGQRLMQSASDIFLGWTRGQQVRDFFIRQLRDMKMSARIEVRASAAQAVLYAELCGRTLAHTHAKSGDAALISGYLGKSDDFDQAVGEFSLAYADQDEQDHAARRCGQCRPNQSTHRGRLLSP